MHDIKKLVGARIRQRRLQRKLTQEQMAEKAEINNTYYGRIERGEANASLELLAAISDALNTTIADLVDTASVILPGKILEDMGKGIDKLPEEQLRRLYRFYKDMG